MRDNEFTRILDWPGYRVFRHEIDETAKTLRLWVRRKRGNRKLICSVLPLGSTQLGSEKLIEPFFAALKPRWSSDDQHVSECRKRPHIRQSAIPARASFRFILALLTIGRAQKPTLKTNPNVT
jgi:hypothetical protein